jgi:hypothetical protein
MFISNKKRVKNNTSYFRVLLALFLVSMPLWNDAAIAAKNKKQHESKPKKQETAYEKLFKGKQVKTSKGFITLHKIDQKVFMEFPLVLLNKDLYINSMVDRVSNMEMAGIGQNASLSRNIVFSKRDSVLMIQLPDYSSLADSSDQNIARALAQSNTSAIIFSAKIEAYSPDSLSVVIDATPFFLSGTKYIANMDRGGIVTYKSNYQKENSTICDVEVSPDNASVISDLCFKMSAVVMGFSGTNSPFTATIRTTIGSLPAVPMQTRLADERVGTAVTEKALYSSKNQGLEEQSFANRWRIEPSDTASYSHGSLVEPLKPIVFYIDSLFPESWARAIKKGVETWNSAFEKIGFRKVLQVLPYPKDDTLFRANNQKYSCIKFIQTPSRVVRKTIRTDPRTGEILSATLYFSREMPVVLQRDRLVQTAAADPAVRTYNLSDSILCESIQALMIRETGVCLGLAYNMAGSSTYPTDSLRSGTFTRQNGLSASVMDQFLYNYIAQPGDLQKGVQMVQTDLGVYDDFIIKWLYTPFLNVQNQEKVKAILSDWIEAAEKDSRLRYGAQQTIYKLSLDPRSLSNDLGDDVLQSTRYSFQNLRYVVEHAFNWVDQFNTDETYKQLFPDFLFLRLYENITQLTYSLGGVYTNTLQTGSMEQAHQPLSREKQREVLFFILDQCRDMHWMDNKDLLFLSGPSANMSAFCERSSFSLLFNRFLAVSISSAQSANAYTLTEMMDDLSGYILKKVRTGETLTRGNNYMLDFLTSYLIQSIHFKTSKENTTSKEEAFALVPIEYQAQQVLNPLLLRCFPDGILPDYVQSGLPHAEEQTSATASNVKYVAMPDMETLCYHTLKKIQSALITGVSKTKDNALKNDYLLLNLKIQKAMNGK